MAKIVWSELALNDIKSIHDYIAKDSVDRTDLIMYEIEGEVVLIASVIHSARDWRPE